MGHDARFTIINLIKARGQPAEQNYGDGAQEQALASFGRCQPPLAQPAPPARAARRTCAFAAWRSTLITVRLIPGHAYS
jgi:hypothetical protein